MTFRDGLSKYSNGQIVQEPWGIIFKSTRIKKPVNAFIAMDERERFKNVFVEKVIQRMTMNVRNDNEHVKEVARLLNWMIVVRASNFLKMLI